MPRTDVHAQIFAKSASDEFVREKQGRGGMGKGALRVAPATKIYN